MVLEDTRKRGSQMQLSNSENLVRTLGSAGLSQIPHPT